MKNYTNFVNRETSIFENTGRCDLINEIVWGFVESNQTHPVHSYFVEDGVEYEIDVITFRKMLGDVKVFVSLLYKREFDKDGRDSIKLTVRLNNVQKTFIVRDKAPGADYKMNQVNWMDQGVASFAEDHGWLTSIDRYHSEEETFYRDEANEMRLRLEQEMAMDVFLNRKIEDVYNTDDLPF